MSTPNKIKFRGATYIKVESATKHERCATGTHWNEKHKKCMRLTGQLAKIHGNAITATKTAKHHSDNAHLTRKKKYHALAMAYHNRAHEQHYLAEEESKKRGFSSLAKWHNKHRNSHYKVYKVHGKKAGKTPYTTRTEFGKEPILVSLKN